MIQIFNPSRLTRQPLYTVPLGGQLLDLEIDP